MSISPSARDAGLYFLGFAGIVVELLAWAAVGRAPDPTLTVGFFGLLGLPSMIGKDQRRNGS